MAHNYAIFWLSIWKTVSLPNWFPFIKFDHDFLRQRSAFQSGDRRVSNPFITRTKVEFKSSWRHLNAEISLRASALLFLFAASDKPNVSPHTQSTWLLLLTYSSDPFEMILLRSKAGRQNGRLVTINSFIRTQVSLEHLLKKFVVKQKEFKNWLTALQWVLFLALTYLYEAEVLHLLHSTGLEHNWRKLLVLRSTCTHTPLQGN